MNDITMEVTNSQPICLQIPDETKNIHTCLLDLNEDCLLKVFSYLKIVDLINVSETCRQLQAVARITAKKHTNFLLWDYKCYKNKVKEPITLGRIFTLTAPFIVSLELSHGVAGKNMHGSIEVQDDLNLNCALEGKHFTNLKSLKIDNSSLLQWINFYNLEELGIRQVNLNDLNNFTEGLTTLKKLTIGRFHEDITSDELRTFLEKNSNIEYLEFYLSFPLRFPYNILPQLRNLTKLSLVVEKCQPNWYSFLQIEKLTELKVKFIDIMTGDRSLPFLIYLENLAQKKTLKKIELSNMSFRGQAFNTLELLNVPKLRIASPQCVNNFFFNLAAQITLSNLTHLDITSWINDIELFQLVDKFKNLQRLKAFHKEGFNNENFLMKLPELFDSSNVSRPTLTLINYREKDHITIFFDLCTYEVITYPSADLKQWDGENESVERSSMFSDWFNQRAMGYVWRNMVCP